MLAFTVLPVSDFFTATPRLKGNPFGKSTSLYPSTPSPEEMKTSQIFATDAEDTPVRPHSENMTLCGASPEPYRFALTAIFQISPDADK